MEAQSGGPSFTSNQHCAVIRPRMNARPEFPQASTDSYREAINDVNRWRGRIVNRFARGELVVAKALLRDGGKPLPMVLCQRIARVSSEAQNCETKTTAITDFVKLTRDRNAIVHGSGRVLLDRDGSWVLTLETVDKSGIHKLAITQADAVAKDRDLKAAVDRLATAFPA